MTISIAQALTELGISDCSKCHNPKAVEEMCKGRTYCKACKNKQMKEWRERNKDHVQQYKRQYAKENPNARKEEYARNPDKHRQRAREWYADNAEVCREKTKQHKLANRHLYNAQQAKRRAIKLNATPKWLTEDDLDVIKWLYEMAEYRSKTTNVKHHVDHIIPLQGEEVCGLHAWWNLQVIPAVDNMSKSNKLINEEFI